MRNPSVTASSCQPPLGKGAEGTGGTDCHSQCAHWLRNDMVFHGVWCKSGRRGYKRCGKTGRRGNRRSAASGGRSELISRKCPDWRPQQWPGIGWHDGGQPPIPTDALQKVPMGGPMWASAPTKFSFHRCRGGRLCPPGPDNTTPCRAGPVCPAVGAVQNRRADVGSELSAAGGRGSEVSEWPRSKF